MIFYDFYKKKKKKFLKGTDSDTGDSFHEAFHLFLHYDYTYSSCIHLFKIFSGLSFPQKHHFNRFNAMLTRSTV